MRLLAVIAFACLGLVGAAGCSDDDFGQERPSSDIGAQQHDMASSDMASTDLTAATSTDLAVAQDGPRFTCGDGYACNNACGVDQACGNACLAKINTANGQTKFKSLQKCQNLALTGVCAGMCAVVDATCAGCLVTACGAEFSACMLDM